MEKMGNSSEVRGNFSFVMKEKLKLLRDHLRRWDIESFGKFNLEVGESIKEINLLDFEA